MISNTSTIGSKLTATVKCWKCWNEFKILCDENDFTSWQHGTFIQQAMPYLSADDRELLISGTCGPCFDKMFPDE